MAPELIDPSQFPGFASEPTTATDIYSFGCTWLEVSVDFYASLHYTESGSSLKILTGKPPFSHHKNDIAVMNDVLKGIRPSRVSVSTCCPDDIWATIESCWTHRPQDRPFIDQIFEKLKACRPTGECCVLSSTNSIPVCPDESVNESERVRSWVHQEMRQNHMLPTPVSFVTRTSRHVTSSETALLEKRHRQRERLGIVPLHCS